ncbi:MAG: hypothetical protein LE179_05620 [Endomicrobium sp.]|nr:hypothetical protein [Endomicrobium sp.]
MMDKILGWIGDVIQFLIGLAGLFYLTQAAIHAADYVFGMLYRLIFR